MRVPKAKRVMQAMLKLNNIDIEYFQRAYIGESGEGEDKNAVVGRSAVHGNNALTCCNDRSRKQCR